MLKKIICLALVAVLAVGCLAGCGGSNGGTKTLKWGIFYANQRDTAIVQEALNKKLETLLPGVQIEFVEQTTDKWSNWMSGGQSIDIAWTGYAYNMEEQIRLGAFTALDELVEEYAPNIQAEMETYKLDYDTGRYTDGTLYAIPNQQPFISETPYLIIPGDTMEFFDVDAFLAETAKSPYTTREIYEIFDDYLEKVHASDVVDTDFVGKYIDVDNLRAYIAMRGYYNAFEDIYYYKIWNDDGTVVTEPELVHMYETDAYKLWAEYVSKWVEDGYASPSMTSSGITGSQVATLGGHVNGMWNDFSNEGDDESRGIKAVHDNYGNITSYQINIEPRDGSHNYYAGATLGAEKTYMVIPYTAQYPEEAMQLLDLLRSPKGTPGNDFLNMLVYGFEKDSAEAAEYGVYHYTLNGDQIHSDEYIQQAGSATTYGQPHWTVGNVMLTYRTELIAEGQQEYAIKYDTETLLTFPELPTAGFVFDTTELTAKITSINEVKGDYAGRIDWGIEPDKTFDLMTTAIAEQKKAGLEDVKTEWYKQYNEFKAK